jgi:adenosylhomocysteine nucleosidase
MGGNPSSVRGAGPATDWLICFAVREEAAFYRRRDRNKAEIVLTGMGRRNAGNAIEKALIRWRPRRVITAGFAGGLNPALRRGTVVFDADHELTLETRLAGVGAAPARFHGADRVAVTAADKELLFRQTGADAVDMESSVIRKACREAGLPSATIRVISDGALDELPLDFNTVLTPSERIDWWRLAGVVLSRPALIHRLIEFRGWTRRAAASLARALTEVVR